MLLVDGSFAQAIIISVSALVGMMGISAGMEGFVESKLNVIQRILCIAGGLLMIIPGTITDGLGIVLLAITFVPQYMHKFKKA